MSSGLRAVSNSSKLTFNNCEDQRATSSKSALETKEEEYKRLNEELEKKTANLVFEAEQALKANEKLIHETDYLNKIGEVNFLDNEFETKNYSRFVNFLNMFFWGRKFLNLHRFIVEQAIQVKGTRINRLII